MSQFEEKYSEIDLKMIDPETIDDPHECAWVMAQLDKISGAIEHQLELVQGGHKEADSRWYADARRALKSVKSTRNATQNHMGYLNRGLQLRYATALTSAFMDQARLQLDPEQFEKIMAAAKRVISTSVNAS